MRYSPHPPTPSPKLGRGGEYIPHQPGKCYIQEGEELLTNLKAANEAQEQYKFGRSTITVKRRQAFRKLCDGVNRINQTGQMVYGSNTADGLLFRSNWRTGNRQQNELEETSE